MTSDLPREPATSAAEPPDGASVRPVLDQEFDDDALYSLRSAVAAHATQAGLLEGRVGDLVTAAHELAANAVVHGPGRGRLRLWKYSDAVHCQVSDTGNGIVDGQDPALWGTRPGSGLWLVRRLVDHMSLQTGPYGTIATISISLGPAERQSEFQVRTERNIHCTVVSVSGELDLRTVPQLVAVVDPIIEERSVPRLVLDLTKLRFWDSSGLAALIATQQRIKALPGGIMVLAGLSAQLLRRLRTVGLADRFTLSPSTHQAVAELGKANG
jgi:anti-anti-sigma factor